MSNFFEESAGGGHKIFRLRRTDSPSKSKIRGESRHGGRKRAISTFNRGGDHGFYIFQFGVGGDIAAGLQDKTLRA